MSEAEIKRFHASDAFRREVEALGAMPDQEIDVSEIPERIPRQWDRPMRTAQLFYRPIKKPVTIRLDADVIEWLKKDGPGYQTKANKILRQQMCAEDFNREHAAKSPSRKPATKNGIPSAKAAQRKSRRA